MELAAREEMMGRRYLRFALAAVGLMAAASAPAQTIYPERLIKMIVPAPAGGQTDVMARLLAQKMKQWLAQTGIIQNLPGAGGALAARAAGTGVPAGCTLFSGTAWTSPAILAECR